MSLIWEKYISCLVWHALLWSSIRQTSLYVYWSFFKRNFQLMSFISLFFWPHWCFEFFFFWISLLSYNYFNNLLMYNSHTIQNSPLQVYNSMNVLKYIHRFVKLSSQPNFITFFLFLNKTQCPLEVTLHYYPLPRPWEALI